MRPTLLVVLSFAVIAGGCSDESTTIPTSDPPPAPIVAAEPEFTAGVSNALNWASGAVKNAGVSYQAQAALDDEFLQIVRSVSEVRTLEHRFEDLVDGVRYHYRVRTMDDRGGASPWSATVASTQDASPPTVSLTYDDELFTSTRVRLTVTADDTGSGLGELELWAARGDDELAFHSDVEPGAVEYLSETGGDLRLVLKAADAVGNRREPDRASAEIAVLPEPVFIVDSPGEAWDVTNAVLGHGMSLQGWAHGIGRNAIRPITDPEHACEGEPGFPEADDMFVALALIDGGDASLLIRLNPMYSSEVWNDEFLGEHFAMTY